MFHEMKKPLILQRADPHVYRHTDGFYYFTASVPEFDKVILRRSETIYGLASAEEKTVWVRHDTGILSKNIWAPEIHYLFGKWYIYFAAARNENGKKGHFDHRIYVLENESPNPLEGCFTEKGQVKTGLETFSLDATTFMHHGIQYLVWAQRDPKIPGNSNLYIASMENPWTIAGAPVLLSKPEFDWECIGYLVNEGPAVLFHDGMINLTYSASATDHNYCMGLISIPQNADLLKPENWSKSPVPVMVTCEKEGIFGPGHNSFTTDSQGNDVLVYHARTTKELAGDPLGDPNRHTFVKPVMYGPDHQPVFQDCNVALPCYGGLCDTV